MAGRQGRRRKSSSWKEGTCLLCAGDQSASDAHHGCTSGNLRVQDLSHLVAQHSTAPEDLRHMSTDMHVWCIYAASVLVVTMIRIDGNIITSRQWADACAWVAKGLVSLWLSLHCFQGREFMEVLFLLMFMGKTLIVWNLGGCEEVPVAIWFSEAQGHPTNRYISMDEWIMCTHTTRRLYKHNLPAY